MYIYIFKRTYIHYMNIYLCVYIYVYIYNMYVYIYIYICGNSLEMFFLRFQRTCGNSRNSWDIILKAYPRW